jgi:Domain of unknown function (DUF4385)
MDMARKYLQMGFTRARRYANHSSGRKYAERASEVRGKAPAQRALLPRSENAEKAKAASVFYGVWQKAERDRAYSAWRRRIAKEPR